MDLRDIGIDGTNWIHYSATHSFRNIGLLVHHNAKTVNGVHLHIWCFYWDSEYFIGVEIHLLDPYINRCKVNEHHDVTPHTTSADHTPSPEANSRLASQEISPPFVEPESSLPHSQKPATDPYPKSTEVTKYRHIIFPYT